MVPTDDADYVEANTLLTHAVGLHARPVVKLAQLAASFKGDVQLRVGADGVWVKARSTAKVMKLKARSNSMLYFRARGEDAAQAVQALVDLVDRDFDEKATETAERMLAGEAASPGLTRGVLYSLRTSAAATNAPQGDPAEERARFTAALEKARQQLLALSAEADELGAEIMAFQIGLLTDLEFTNPVLQGIADGLAAVAAWRQVVDAEIADYGSAEDEYFRARTVDLADLGERVAALLVGANTVAAPLPENAVLVVDELTPSLFLEIDWTRCVGAAMRRGSYTSHVSMLARARGKPLLIKLQAQPNDLPDAAVVILDAEHGRLIVNPGEHALADYAERSQVRVVAAANARQFLDKSAQTADGAAVRVYVNVDEPGALAEVDPAHCDGVGLTRTEFLFYGRASLPDEETQYRVYCSLLDWAAGKPVTIRTLDAGGDKPIAGLTANGESNPFLGLRGLRLSLVRSDVFKVQLRALARAAVRGPLKVMVPMVTVPQELEAARGLLRKQVEHLQRDGVAAAMPAFGMMVEVPAAALRIADFDCDFFSIGSNDLVQYVMAAGRDATQLAHLQDPLHPAVLELINRVAARATERSVEASVCGEMAAQRECLPALLGTGVRALSVPPAALAAVKAALAECRASGNG